MGPFPQTQVLKLHAAEEKFAAPDKAEKGKRQLRP